MNYYFNLIVYTAVITHKYKSILKAVIKASKNRHLYTPYSMQPYLFKTSLHIHLSWIDIFGSIYKMDKFYMVIQGWDKHLGTRTVFECLGAEVTYDGLVRYNTVYL